MAHTHASFVHGAIGRWLYLMRTIDIKSSIFQPLEDVTHLKFIPALTSQVSSSPEMRKLLFLPFRLGGLNIIINQVEIAESQLEQSPHHWRWLSNSQTTSSSEPSQLQAVKSALHWEKCQTNDAKAEQVKGKISATLQNVMMDLNTEKCVSIWLTVLYLCRNNSLYAKSPGPSLFAIEGCDTRLGSRVYSSLNKNGSYELLGCWIATMIVKKSGAGSTQHTS